MGVFTQLVMVVFVMALLGLVTWRLKGARARRTGKAAPIAVVGRLALTPQHSLHLVEVAGRTLLLATHASGCRLLARVPAQPTPTAAPPEPSRRSSWARIGLMVCLLAAVGATAQAAPQSAGAPQSLFGISAQPGRPGSLSVPMQVVALLAALTLLPAAIMSITPFLRITVVLHFLRQALGTQTTPSNQVLVGLSMFLTLLIMQPVLTEIYTQGWAPMEKGEITLQQAVERGSQPLRAFLTRFAREKDVALLLEITRTPAPASPAELELKVLIPAYVLSELKTGFQIGAVLFLPFLIIDLVVASVTLSIGMVQLPPVMLSAPFKILLFVLVDGWNLVVGSLVKSFY